jgi:peptidoglycan/xylan/chitin deacetylase (PgdA/CDA1 family)
VSEKQTLRADVISKDQMQEPLRRLYLLYHELRPSESQYSYVLETGMFERHVDLFVQLRKAGSSGLWPEVTFDDGHISNFEYAAPILQSRGLTAQFFITVGWTGNRHGYMGWPELRALHESGQSIGAHGWTHSLLTHCTERDLQTELSSARLTLEDKLGTSITTMSLPGGRYNRRVLAACEEAGYLRVYTSVPRAEPLPLGATIGRLNIRGDMQPEWIANLVQPDSSALFRLGRQYQMKAAAKGLLGDRLYEKLWALLNRKEPDSDERGDNAE